MLSRLKGIETLSQILGQYQILGHFGYAFPFEGNGNLPSKANHRHSVLWLWICFPVWRELKLVVALDCLDAFFFRAFGYAFPFEGNWNSYFSHYFTIRIINLWICFPVWRELKPLGLPLPRQVRHQYFGYAFPFEGNWNSIVPFFNLGFHFALDMLSRLKGIETLLIGRKGMKEQDSHFGYAFPFEGNWNHANGAVCIFSSSMLWICFPVWRELKHYILDTALAGLSKALDMLSRLKGIETKSSRIDSSDATLDFGYAFPFEGNGN